MKSWRLYERLVAKLCTEEYDDKSLTTIPNAHITGKISNRKRQIDFLVDYRFDNDTSRRIIIDAKNRRRPIDIKEVESFEGLMKDVEASRGIIISTNGYTQSALRRAQEHIGLRIIPEKDIEELDLRT
ncbi:MAG: restriction endonuclease [Rikenellaceae bacterium]|nr:restriction endonuclease [Rikenellaceae bacterium]